jgi:hypothetical protein
MSFGMDGDRAGTASARPCEPGRARRSGHEGARAAGRPSGAGTPTRRAAQSVSERGVRAAVEASPAACRAQRRAGAVSAGADVTQRSNAERRNDGDGGLDARSLPRPILWAQAVRPARPLDTGRSAAEEEADDVTAARRWRDVCRLDHSGRCERDMLRSQPRQLLFEVGFHVEVRAVR